MIIIKKRVIILALCMGMILSQLILYKSNMAYSTDNDYARLDRLYQEYEQICSQDPRLQTGQGYYVNPRQLRNADIGAAIMQGRALSGADLQAIKQREYEGQLSNQLGVPYADYLAAQQEKTRCLNSLKRSQIDLETIRMMQANGATPSEIARFAELNALNNYSYALQNQNINVNHSGTINNNVNYSGNVNVNHKINANVNHKIDANVNGNYRIYHY